MCCNVAESELCLQEGNSLCSKRNNICSCSLADNGQCKPIYIPGYVAKLMIIIKRFKGTQMGLQLVLVSLILEKM